MNNFFLSIKRNKFLESLLVWSHQGKELSRRTIIIGLLFCLVISFGIRIFSSQIEPTISRDGIYYIRCAELMQQHDKTLEKKFLIDSSGKLHLYSIYLSLSNILHLTPAQLAIRTNIFLGAILPLILFAMAKILFKNSEIALAVAFLGALHPKLIQYSIAVQREIPYMVFCGMFFLCLLYFCFFDKWYCCIGMGAFVALGIFFRYECAELLLVAMVAFVVYFYKSQSKFLKKLLLLIIFILSFCINTMVFLMVLKKSPQENISMLLNRITIYSKLSHQ